MKKRTVSKAYIAIVLLIAMVPFLFSGCLPGQTTSTTTGSATSATTGTTSSGTTVETTEPLKEGITLTMWTFLDPSKTSGREKALKQIIDNFKAEYNITVVVEPQVWDTMSAKFFAAHAAGNAPDVQWVNVDDMGTAIKLGVLEPFENMFMRDWTAEQLDNVKDGFWDYAATDDKHYQMGFSRNYVGIMYREDLLKAAGYSAPFKNWDEFREAAKALTVANDPITGIQRFGFGFGLTVDKSDPLAISNMLLKEYGTMFDATGKANWANETGVKGVELLTNMIKVDKSVPETIITNNVDDIYKDFASGKYAMINGASVRIEKAQSESVFDPATIQIMPFPSFVEGEPSPAAITGWCVGVWSGSKNKQEAGKFLEFMFLPESDKLWVEIGGQVPMNKATVELSKEFLANPAKRYLPDTAKWFATAAWTQPTEFTVTGWRGDFCQAMQDVLTKNEDPMVALQNAEKRFNERNGR